MLAGPAVAVAAHAMANLSVGWAVGLASLMAVVLFLAHARITIRQYKVGLADLT